MTERRKWRKGEPVQLANTSRIVCPPNMRGEETENFDLATEVSADIILRPNGHHYVHRGRKQRGDTYQVNFPHKCKTKRQLRQQSLPDIQEKLNNVLEIIDKIPLPREPTLSEWAAKFWSTLQHNEMSLDQLTLSNPLPSQCPESSIVGALFYYLLEEDETLLLRCLLVVYDMHPDAIVQYVKNNAHIIPHYAQYVQRVIRDALSHTVHAGTLMILLLSSQDAAVNVDMDIRLLWDNFLRFSADEDTEDDLAGMCATLLISLWKQESSISLCEWLALKLSVEMHDWNHRVLVTVLCDCVLNELDGLSDLIIDGLCVETISPFLEYPLCAIESLAHSLCATVVNDVVYPYIMNLLEMLNVLSKCNKSTPAETRVISSLTETLTSGGVLQKCCIEHRDGVLGMLENWVEDSEQVDAAVVKCLQLCYDID